MSLHPQAADPIPDETQRMARAAFPRGNLYMQVADRRGTIYQDAQFAALFPRRGHPAEAPARLALVTVLQFAEGFSERQAADAVRSRIDWNYVLGLELADPGFHHPVRSEFRPRLVAGEAASHLRDALLTLARTPGLLTTRGRQRTDSTSVVAASRILHRLERVGETLRAALNSRAIVAPAWLQALAPREWDDRYSRRVENDQRPKTAAARKALAAVIGADGQTLLHAVATAVEQPWLQEMPAVKTLPQVWAEPYIEVNGRLSGREGKDRPSPAELIASPYDPEARYSTTREVEWVGDKVHLTETCDADHPNLITQVMTTPATTQDRVMGPAIQQDLADRDLLPGTHLLDSGYVDADLLVTAQVQHQIDVVGPPFGSYSRQRREGNGDDLQAFVID